MAMETADFMTNLLERVMGILPTLIGKNGQ